MLVKGKDSMLPSVTKTISKESGTSGVIMKTDAGTLYGSEFAGVVKSQTTPMITNEVHISPLQQAKNLADAGEINLYLNADEFLKNQQAYGQIYTKRGIELDTSFYNHLGENPTDVFQIVHEKKLASGATYYGNLPFNPTKPSIMLGSDEYIVLDSLMRGKKSGDIINLDYVAGHELGHYFTPKRLAEFRDDVTFYGNKDVMLKLGINPEKVEMVPESIANKVDAANEFLADKIYKRGDLIKEELIMGKPKPVQNYGIKGRGTQVQVLDTGDMRAGFGTDIYSIGKAGTTEKIADVKLTYGYLLNPEKADDIMRMANIAEPMKKDIIPSIFKDVKDLDVSSTQIVGESFGKTRVTMEETLIEYSQGTADRISGKAKRLADSRRDVINVDAVGTDIKQILKANPKDYYNPKKTSLNTYGVEPAQPIDASQVVNPIKQNKDSSQLLEMGKSVKTENINKQLDVSKLRETATAAIGKEAENVFISSKEKVSQIFEGVTVAGGVINAATKTNSVSNANLLSVRTPQRSVESNQNLFSISDINSIKLVSIDYGTFGVGDLLRTSVGVDSRQYISSILSSQKTFVIGKDNQIVTVRQNQNTVQGQWKRSISSEVIQSEYPFIPPIKIVDHSFPPVQIPAPTFGWPMIPPVGGGVGGGGGDWFKPEKPSSSKKFFRPIMTIGQALMLPKNSLFRRVR